MWYHTVLYPFVERRYIFRDPRLSCQQHVSYARGADRQQKKVLFCFCTTFKIPSNHIRANRTVTCRQQRVRRASERASATHEAVRRPHSVALVFPPALAPGVPSSHTRRVPAAPRTHIHTHAGISCSFPVVPAPAICSCTCPHSQTPSTLFLPSVLTPRTARQDWSRKETETMATRCAIRFDSDWWSTARDCTVESASASARARRHVIALLS